VLLGALPGLAAVAALALCASGVERTGGASARPVAARSVTTPYSAAKPHIVPRSAWLDGSEGRAGGVDRPVTGAHTQGFNHGTTGIAALGTFTAGVPVPQAMTDAIARLAAWKLGLSGIDPRADVPLVSSNGLSRYAAGTTAKLPALAGHKDGFMTNCPGAALSALLPQIRQTAASLQGR
jgi:hypothetical protein